MHVFQGAWQLICTLCRVAVISNNSLWPAQEVVLCAQQDWQAQAVQCEGDMTFQRGQIQQAYISQLCSQLQQEVQVCVQAAAQQAAPPLEAQPAALDLVLSLVHRQASLLRLAPPSSLTQVPPIHLWRHVD